MKTVWKMILIFVIAAMFLSACGINEPIEKPFDEEEKTAPEETLDIVKDCVFKENGKYPLSYNDFAQNHKTKRINCWKNIRTYSQIID